MLAVVWMYPRGQAVADEKDPQLIAGAAGVAACIGADFAKVNYPRAFEGMTAPESLGIAVEAAGRTGIICSGGGSMPPRSSSSACTTKSRVRMPRRRTVETSTRRAPRKPCAWRRPATPSSAKARRSTKRWPCISELGEVRFHRSFERMRSTVAFAEFNTPGKPAPGCVPAPTRYKPECLSPCWRVGSMHSASILEPPRRPSP